MAVSHTDVMLTKRCGNAYKKTAILKQLPTHFKAKREKDVGTPFARVPAPLHPCSHIPSMQAACLRHLV